MIQADSAKREGQPLVVLTGPTAVGKTQLSIKLAKRIDGEIISADSMQVYQHMDIGSAKITPSQMAGVPHHLIDILMPDEEFNVAVFQQRCREAMDDIYARGRIPIITGGTGFYIQAVLYEIDFTAAREDTRCRQQLEALAAEQGALALHRLLAEKDPEAAAKIHAHNVKRVIRALEFHQQTGMKISAHNEQERSRRSPYRYCYFVLNDERSRLYARINQRVDQMIADGLVQEVSTLQAMGCHQGMVSMQGLGYKEILRCLNGEISLEEAVYLIKRDTRHFAKRQLTWFRREKDVTWIEKEQFGGRDELILAFMEQQIHKQIINKTGNETGNETDEAEDI